MRLFPPALVPLAVAAAVLAPAGSARAVPVCAASEPGDFPLTTRIHGGPDAYEAGGGHGTWYLDLTNRTARTCTAIHPVVVLTDRERALTVTQPRLEFYEEDGRARPVRFEATDEDELVGAFGGAGFTVGPGKTVTVKVRLALASDAVPNEVTANAAVVQRHEDDGDWVGQSGDYRFDVEAGPGSGPDTPAETGTAPGTDADAGTGAGTETGTATGSAGDIPPGDAAARPPGAPELAATGLADPVRTLGAAVAVLLFAGTAFRLVRRRR
ncbi:hypothetical protein ACIPSE_05905 [Streptomyces sp. NPDC090106]|uniref:hypothetical protein n=1 Tax=Streptomyces sp. NPDC090106 TaxID=3365946 RepID=UPI0037F7610F